MTDENQELEIHDDNEIVESHEDQLNERSEPMGDKPSTMTTPPTEADSVASVKAAAGKTKKASPPKTKAGMKAAMAAKAEGMTKIQLQSLYASVMEEEVELDDEEAIVEDTTKDELEVMISEDESLSEDFKAKASVLFEAAINNRVATKVSELDEEFAAKIESLEEQFATETEESIEEAKVDLVDKMDSYLNYVVENWMEENRLAVEQGIRTEIAEGFMSKLKDLFTESYIEVPESKVDLVDQLAEEVQELEGLLNAETANNVAMNEKVNNLKRSMIITEASKDLAETQAAKLLKLAEGVDFENEETFAFKIETIKESYFSAKSDAETPAAIVEETLTEETQEDTDQVEVSSSMAQYIAALKAN